MLTCGASGAPLFSPSIRVTAGYRGEDRGDNKRDNAHRQKGSAVGENSNSAFYIALRCLQTNRQCRVAPSRPESPQLVRTRPYSPPFLRCASMLRLPLRGMAVAIRPSTRWRVSGLRPCERRHPRPPHGSRVARRQGLLRWLLRPAHVFSFVRQCGQNVINAPVAWRIVGAAFRAPPHCGCSG